MRTKRKPTGLIVLLVVVVAIVVAVVLYQRKQAQAKAPVITTARVERGEVFNSVSATGTLEPLSTVEVKSNIGGQVILLTVDEGDYVKAGQLIARIDPSDTESNLRQVEADLTGARARVDAARQSIDLQRIQTSTGVESAQQALASARLRLAQAEKQATMQTAVSGAGVAQAQEALAAAKVRLAQAQAQAKVQPQLTATAIQQAQSNLASAQAAYAQMKAATIPQKLANAQASYNEAKANFAYAEKDLTRQRELLAKGFVARSTVDASEQRFTVAKAQLDTAANKLETVKDETAQDLQAAQAKVDQAASALASAKVNGVQDDLKQQDVASAQAAVKQAEASLANARANVLQDDVKTADIAAARAAVKQAEANLAAAKAGAYQEAMKRADMEQAQASMARSQASVTNAQTQLGYTTILAPCSGVVVKKYAEVGSIVVAGRSSFSGSGVGVGLVDIADVSHMQVQVSVDETDIAQIHLGQQVDVTIDAFSGEKFNGTVTKIAPEAEVSQNVTTVPVTVRLDRTDTRLKTGLNATCDFIITRKEHVLLVPNEAIKDTPRGSIVLVKKGNERQPRPVKTGVVGNEKTEIISGLHEGDDVITSETTPTPPKGGFGPGGRRGMRPPPM
jgi:HlyD family secretion protein